MKKMNREFKMQGDIKDRGNIKWQGLMLPEHIQMLREWYEEDQHVPRPDLDEFDLQLIQEELDIALKRKCEVLIETWKDKQIFKHRGVIEDINIARRELVYESPFGTHRLALDEIVAVTLID
ncbi:YolD-like family protein [Planococcus sp. CAU13]|uniref:YolD-like family protein n=1 Tax=Planococcus sp. CAU13 TaxID=1541197 RepID=UPI000691CAC8|nr:YolD-like family protein [Planococcus sp. CAU13]